MAEALVMRTAAEVLEELRRGGYTQAVITRVEVHEHRIGPHPITYADRLRVSPPPPEPLQEEIHEHRDLLLAAACVINPPSEPRWVGILVQRARKDPKLTAMLAANIAPFCDLHPAQDGPRLVPIIGCALRWGRHEPRRRGFSDLSPEKDA